MFFYCTHCPNSDIPFSWTTSAVPITNSQVKAYYANLSKSASEETATAQEPTATYMPKRVEFFSIRANPQVSIVG